MKSLRLPLCVAILGWLPALAAAETRVVVLGSGTPVLDADRAGAGIAVVYNGRAYLFDLGAGVVQRAIEASRTHRIPGLEPTSIDRIFFTHLHSDHVLDFAELAATLWWRKEVNVRVWGPSGVSQMAEGMYAMMASDIAIRNGGTQPVTDPEGYKVESAEIDEGIVLEEDGLTVEAFAVMHGAIRPAFGYRITTPDRTIVISGDTAYSDKLVEMAQDADILFHEVISETGLGELEPFWQNYHSAAHTTTSELARIANQARPALLVLYHVLYYAAPIQSALDEVRALYDGEVVLADDLDIY
jgi:ribonuclease BN (tRNA processing enzyme)